MKVTVIAHPNSKNPRIETDLLECIHVYVKEPPLEGRANRAIVEALADYYKVKKNMVFFLSGEKFKKKLFEIHKNIE